ncbi:unnamed protein product [Ectocarpus sp. 4 AP-2014]
MDTETSRPRRHSVGTGQRGAISRQHVDDALPGFGASSESRRTASSMIRPPEDGKLSAGGAATAGRPRAGPSVPSSSSSKRRRSASGRRGRRSSADFSFSPYQPMVIETTSSSVSPRPRRASAPVPPTSLLPFKPLMAGEKRQQREPGADGGPTLDQCLVLPSGVALKIDGLLSTSGVERECGVSIGNGDGAVGADVDRGGGDDDMGNGSSNSLEKDGAGVACPLPGAERDDDDGGDRAIISSFHFNTSGSQAVLGVEAGECLEEEEQAAASCDKSATVETPDAPETTPGISKGPPVGSRAQEEVPQCISDRGYSGSIDSSNDASNNGNGSTNCDETYDSHHVVDRSEPQRHERPGGQPSSPETGDVCGSSMVCDEEETTAIAAAATSGNDGNHSANNADSCESHRRVEGDEPLREASAGGQPSSPETAAVCASSMVVDEGEPAAATVASGNDSTNNDGSYDGHRSVQNDKAQRPEPPGGLPSSPETEVCVSPTVGNEEESAAALAADTAPAAIDDALTAFVGSDTRGTLVDAVAVSESPSLCGAAAAAAGSSTIVDKGDQGRTVKNMDTNNACISGVAPCARGEIGAETSGKMEAEAEGGGDPRETSGAGEVPNLPGIVYKQERLGTLSETTRATDTAPGSTSEEEAKHESCTEPPAFHPVDAAGAERETTAVGVGSGAEASPDEARQEEVPLPQLADNQGFHRDDGSPGRAAVGLGSSGRSSVKAKTGEASTVLATGDTSAVGGVNAGASDREGVAAVDVNERGSHVWEGGILTPSGTCGEASAQEGAEGQGGDEAAGNVRGSEVEMALGDGNDGARPNAGGEDKGESGQEDASEARAGAGTDNCARVAVEAREGFTAGRASDEQVLESATSVVYEGARGVVEKAMADEGMEHGMGLESVISAENHESETEEMQGDGQNEEGDVAEQMTVDEEHLATGSRMDDVKSAVSPGLPSDEEGDVQMGEEEESKEEEEEEEEEEEDEKERSDEGSRGEEVEHGNSIVDNETLVEEAPAGLSSSAPIGMANNSSVEPAADISDGFISSFTEDRLDNSTAALDVAPAEADGATPPVDWDILAKNQAEEVEVPLDWEALAREVEAEWVLEGSGDESELSFTANSPPVNAPASPAKAAEAFVQNSGDEHALATAEERPPSLASVGVVDSASAHGSSEPERQQEVEVEGEPESRAGGDEGEPPESAPRTATPPHPRRNVDDSGSGGSSGVAVTPASDANLRQDTKEANDDSDCGSALSLTDGPVSSIAGLPAAEATSSTPALAGQPFVQDSEGVTPTHAFVGAAQISVSASPARSQQAQRATSSTAPEQDAGACSPAKADPPPSPSNAPGQPESEAATEISGDGNGVPVCLNSGHQDAQVADPVVRVPPVGDGRDGVARPPEAERNGSGDVGITCAQGSCGCVLM